jgi:hypothetical protein
VRQSASVFSGIVSCYESMARDCLTDELRNLDAKRIQLDVVLEVRDGLDVWIREPVRQPDVERSRKAAVLRKEHSPGLLPRDNGNERLRLVVDKQDRRLDLGSGPFDLWQTPREECRPALGGNDDRKFQLDL